MSKEQLVKGMIKELGFEMSVSIPPENNGMVIMGRQLKWKILDEPTGGFQVTKFKTNNSGVWREVLVHSLSTFREAILFVMMGHMNWVYTRRVKIVCNQIKNEQLPKFSVEHFKKFAE